jgi:hypothetical protein
LLYAMRTLGVSVGFFDDDAGGGGGGVVVVGVWRLLLLSLAGAAAAGAVAAAAASVFNSNLCLPPPFLPSLLASDTTQCHRRAGVPTEPSKLHVKRVWLWISAQAAPWVKDGFGFCSRECMLLAVLNNYRVPVVFC